MVDQERYPYQFEVRDAHGRRRMVRVGAENGQVIFDVPAWGFFQCDPDVGDSINVAMYASCELARTQRRAGQR